MAWWTLYLLAFNQRSCSLLKGPGKCLSTVHGQRILLEQTSSLGCLCSARNGCDYWSKPVSSGVPCSWIVKTTSAWEAWLTFSWGPFCVLLQAVLGLEDSPGKHRASGSVKGVDLLFPTRSLLILKIQYSSPSLELWWARAHQWGNSLGIYFFFIPSVSRDSVLSVSSMVSTGHKPPGLSGMSDHGQWETAACVWSPQLTLKCFSTCPPPQKKKTTHNQPTTNKQTNSPQQIKQKNL